MFCEMRLDRIKNTFLFRDAVELMEQLGHKQISTTLRYIHMSNANLLPNNNGYDGVSAIAGLERRF